MNLQRSLDGLSALYFMALRRPFAWLLLSSAAAGRGPFRDLTALLNTITGIASLAATSILAETRTDMSRFASEGHLVSWAGLSPWPEQ